MSSPLEGSTSIISLIVTIITGVVVAILYITTRFGKGEIKGAVIHTQTAQMATSISNIQDEFRENHKETKDELKELSREVQKLTNTISLEQYTSNEIKQSTLELTKRINGLERKIYDLDRRVGGRGPRGVFSGDKSNDENGGNNGNSAYWCL